MSKLVLIGFMGAGKTTAARAIDQNAVDVDEVIEERLGKRIDRVFAEDGEEKFRRTEEQVTLELLADDRIEVLALGGGAVTSRAVRAALEAHTVMWIDVHPDLAWRRCEPGKRPLAGERGQFERLHAQREPLYAQLADAVVPAQRTDQINSILGAVSDDAKLLWAASESGDYPVYLARGLITQRHFWPSAVQGRRFVVTDGNVGRLYGELLEPVAGRVSVMPGEQSKTVAHAEIVWSELARAGMTRADVVVAFGGGVIGDLAGFCAATYQRGVRYVQVPTSLVAQVDSAYGGKTGVDLPGAKNYVGAYHQPSAVLVDPEMLESLPPEELAAGYSEVIKTALIAGGWLWERVRLGAEPNDPEVICACALTKLRIVAQDERDAGIRQALNLGHTVGHAIEAVTGYARYRHGEAVALGLLVALRLSGQDELRTEVGELLERHGLPTTLDGTDPGEVVRATASDKKRLYEGPVPFVLLDAPGHIRTRCPVKASTVAQAVRELVR